MEKINNLEHLHQLCEEEDGMLECCIILKGGLRSSKGISYSPGGNKSEDRYSVLNYIDDSWQDNITLKELEDNTNIIKALKLGALFKY